ncbi:MAG TPA: hypothetical protein VJ785_05160 [Anaerolineales bacterium]|nr:hypothetical protein [Anaerolineales bacterium]
MNKRQNRVYRFETLHHNRDNALSLLPLNTLLTKAQKELPPRLVIAPDDASEELALKLMAGVKLQFKRTYPAHWIGSPLLFGLNETAGTDVR